MRSSSSSSNYHHHGSSYSHHHGHSRHHYSSSSSYNTDVSMPSSFSSQQFAVPMATDTLVLKGQIPPGYTYEGLRDVVKVYGPVVSVRIIRDRITGESKGYSFAQFSSPRDAHSLLAATGGCIRLPEGGLPLTMDFVRPDSRNKIGPGSSHIGDNDSSAGYSHTQQRKTDWICPACNADNFSRREVCFKCNFPRPKETKNPDENTKKENANISVEKKDGNEEEKSMYDESTSYTTTINVRGLSSETDERTLLCFFSRIAPVKAIRLSRDKDTGYSRGSCYIEFYCIDDADGAVKLTNGTVIERGGFPVSVSLASNGFTASKPAEECLGVVSGTLAFRYTGGPVQLIDTEGNFVYGNSFGTADKATLNAWIDYANNLNKYIEASQTVTSGNSVAAQNATTMSQKNITINVNSKEVVNTNKNKNTDTKESDEDIDASLDEFFKDLNGGVENISTISAAPVKNDVKPEQDKKSEEKSDEMAALEVMNEGSDDKELSFENSVDPIGHLIPDTVCVLCMRQLPSVEALQRHIELSKLHKYHKERLEQERKLKRKPCNSELEEIEQEERMGERSALYKYLDIKYPMKKRQHRSGPDYDKIATAMIREQLRSRAEENEGKASVDKEISESNIGSKMLKKMGWSHGEGLGKDGAGIKAPIALMSYDKHAGVGSGVTVQINPGDSYSERARKYAMASYEELRKKTEKELSANPKYNGIK